jgi:small conductance mechanosensitive channel
MWQWEGLMKSHGLELIMALVVLIVGMLLVRLLMKLVRKGLTKTISNPATSTTITNIIYVFLLSGVIISASMEIGIDIDSIFSTLIIILLVVVGLLLFFRPYIPSLPFKVGQTIKACDLLGKVEATTFLNTRIRTFDGKVFFVPNRIILNDIVINYHYTPTRRIKIDIPIAYDQDIIKAKQTLEALMIEDPRVEKTPRPVVWVMDLSNGCIMLGGRCWADNLKYWSTRIDLLEKAKHRFDNEGIIVSYPHVGVHHFYQQPDGKFTEKNRYAGMLDPESNGYE